MGKESLRGQTIHGDMIKKHDLLKDLLFFSLLIVFISNVFAADVASVIDKLFSQEEWRTKYAEVYIPLKTLFIQIEQEGFPVESLLDKLREGLAKKVSPQVLLTGIKDETQRIKQAFELLNKIQFSYANQAEKTELYKNISLFLLGGLKIELLEQMLVGVQVKKDTVKVFLSLGTTILKLKAATSLSEEELATLTGVLLKSTLNYSTYPLVTSLFVKAKIRRVSDQEMFSLVVNILTRGGSVLEIEEELSRRSKK
jgi:hypothetical protein